MLFFVYLPKPAGVLFCADSILQQNIFPQRHLDAEFIFFSAAFCLCGFCHNGRKVYFFR